MKLTKNFTINELIYSVTAEANGIDNRASIAVVSNLKALCENILQPLRDHFNKPVKVTSGYRCLELNQKIGGKHNSQHLTGNAADIIIPDVPLFDVYEYIRTKLPYDQLLLETNKKGTQWIHVSYLANARNRHQAMQIKA